MIEELEALIAKLKRYDPEIVEVGCGCCSSWATMEEWEYGDFIELTELKALLKELKESKTCLED